MLANSYYLLDDYRQCSIRHLSPEPEIQWMEKQEFHPTEKSVKEEETKVTLLKYDSKWISKTIILQGTKN